MMESKLYDLLMDNLYCYNYWWDNDDVFSDAKCRKVEEDLNNKVLELAQDISISEAEKCRDKGYTILHFLVWHNYYEATEILLNKGINVNVVGTDAYSGVTPLHLACYNGNYNMAKLLIKYNADTTLRDDLDRNCFHYLASFSYKDIISSYTANEYSIKQRLDIIPLLKCNINDKDKSGLTPFLQLISNYEFLPSKELSREFIKYNADITIRDSFGNTPLILAAKNNKISVAILLMEYKDLINCQNDEGDTAMHVAVKNQLFEIAFVLMDKKADLNIPNNKGETCIELIENGYDNMIKYYYDKNFVFKIGEMRDITERAFNNAGKPLLDGYTYALYTLKKLLSYIDDEDDAAYIIDILYDALVFDDSCYVIDILHDANYNFEMEICYRNTLINTRDYCIENIRNINLIKKFYDLGINLNQALSKGITPISILADMNESNSGFNSAYEDYYKEAVKYFSKESMEALDYEGKSALHKAARNNHSKMMLEMINKGVDINLSEDSPSIPGVTPLHIACYYGKSDTVKVLMDNNANDSLKTVDGETPAHSLLKSKNKYIKIEENDYRDIISLLKDIDAPRNDGKTPIMLLQQLSSNAVYEFTSLLINKGARVDNCDNEDNSVLTLHVHYNNHKEILKELINSGADVNHKDNEGNTALHYSLNNGYIDIARFLINKGANYNTSNNDGITPAEIAIENGYEEVLALMTEIDVDALSKNLNCNNGEYGKFLN